VADLPELDDYDVTRGLVAWGELDVCSMGRVPRTASHRIALRFPWGSLDAGMAPQSGHVRPGRGRLGLIPVDKLRHGGGMVEEDVRMGDSNERYRSRDPSVVDSDRRWLGAFLSEFI